MNAKLQNIRNAFKNVRTRSIIIVTIIILLIGFLLGFRHLMDQTAPATDSTVELKDPPNNIQSIPGGLKKPPSADYQRLQHQQNLQQAALAEKTGASVIPTLLDSSDFNASQNHQMGGNNQCYRPCSCCQNNPCANQVMRATGTSLLQPSDLRSGTLVYDTSGKVIGRLGADGKVRNPEGEVIGQVGPDGLVRASDGSVIGSAAAAAAGDPVYDATGHLIGTVGADGKVRDAQGKVIGAVSADGTVRDAKGAVIGKAANAKSENSGSGAAAYDAQGHLIGHVGADGKVRDVQGHVIGTVGSDGVVHDANGNVIGHANPKSANADSGAVYDAQGHLIGHAGADGKVRDAQGHVIGTLGADGVVHDADGNVIGHANAKSTNHASSAAIPGAPVYDKDGKLIGTVGSDGRVRDANGKVLGTLGADGTLRDKDQHVIGKVGATAPGAPVYDKQGHLVGTVGPDGIVRDSQGRAIAKIGADGIAHDPEGNPLGSTTPPPSLTSNDAANANQNASVSLLPSASDSNKQALQAILDRQAQQISAQKAEQLQQQMQSSMSTQASQLFAAWVSPAQQYVAGSPDANLSLGSINGLANAAASAVSVAPPAVKAGTIMYAVLLTSVNSDEPGPVLAEIVQGKFKGGRLVGALTKQGQKVLLSFNTLTLPNVSQSIPINTVAIDESTARTALSSYTDNHNFLRYGTLFASAFIQGFGQSFLATGSPYAGAVVINPDNSAINLNMRDRVFVGLGQVGVQYASALGSVFSTPPTVHVYSGTPMGILFLSDLPALPKE